jgi:hypothetical protein
MQVPEMSVQQVHDKMEADPSALVLVDCRNEDEQAVHSLTTAEPVQHAMQTRPGTHIGTTMMYTIKHAMYRNIL